VDALAAVGAAIICGEIDTEAFFNQIEAPLRIVKTLSLSGALERLYIDEFFRPDESMCSRPFILECDCHVFGLVWIVSAESRHPESPRNSEERAGTGVVAGCV